MVVSSTLTDNPSDDLLNPDEEARYTSKPVEDACKPELVVKFKPNIFPEVLDNGVDMLT